MFISFSNGNGSAFENSLDSGRISFRKRPCAMYKDNAVGNGVAETGRDFGTTVRHDWAIFQCRCQARFDAHLNRLQGHRWQPIARSGNLCDLLIRGERWIVLMLSPIARDVQRQCCWKRGSGDGQRLSLYDYGTTERSFNAVERWGSTLTCTVCTAADSEERQICTTCLFAESVGLWKRRRSYAFSHRYRGAHFCLRGGWGKRGRFDVVSRSETPKTSCQNHKQQLLRPRSGPSKATHTRTTRVKEQQVLSKYRKKESN